MANIEKQQVINPNNLNSKFYFISILKEACACKLLSEFDIEKVQMQCLEFLAYKSGRYSGGKSSSIKVEIAENIMNSNLYTMGLYLKSLPDADCAADELKTTAVPEMYQKGRKIIDIKFQAAKHIYKLARQNRINTLNYTYNATLEDSGIGIFFNAYNPDYEAHEIPASIDYQLCNPVNDLVGVEFIQKYLENLYLENQFCANFAAENIHYLLCGYDQGYQDLLLNIFEQVLTETLGCWLVQRNIKDLAISVDEIQQLQTEWLKDTGSTLNGIIFVVAEKVSEELHITNPSLRRYIKKSLSKITTNIAQAIKTNNLDKVFLSPIDPEESPRVKFSSGVKMDDTDYRMLIDELLLCRYSADKLALIKEAVSSFGDLEDVLFDADLNEEEVGLILDMVEDVELAVIMSRHPFKSDIQIEGLAEKEIMFRLYLKNYINRLPTDRQEKAFETLARLVDENHQRVPGLICIGNRTTGKFVSSPYIAKPRLHRV